jgi:hypothetical protein
MKKYRASGRVPFGGLILLILGAIIGSLLVGGLVFGVSHLIYLIVFFPLFMGFIGGGILAWTVKRGKVRSPILAGLFGLIMGVAIIGVYRFAEYYVDFRNEVTSSVRESGGQDVSQQDIDEFIDKTLEKETGSSGFIGYLKYSASLGMTITPTSPSSSSSPMELDERGTIIYSIIELLAVALICAGVAFAAARQPFNEEADEWYPVPRYVGRVDWKSRKEFYKLIKAGDIRGAFKMVSNTPVSGHRVDVVAQYTPSVPQSDVILTVKETRINRKRQTSGTKMRGVVSAQEFADLTRMIGGAQSAQPAVVQFSGASGSLD